MSRFLLTLALLAAGSLVQASPPALLNPPATCNVVWDSPSADAKGSMPIGNGDIGLNVWVEPEGDLVFLIGKTDTWDENMRLLKLGKLRVKFTPPLVQPEAPFSQTLDLAHGRIVIKSATSLVTVWVDANQPVIEVDAEALTPQKLEATAAFEIWRKEKRTLTDQELGYDNFPQQSAFSWPDTVLPAADNQIGWYHRNEISPWLASLQLQGLEDLAKTQTDPLLNRTMGAVLRGENFVAASPTELKTKAPAAKLSLRIFPHTQIAPTVAAWRAALEQQASAVEKLDPAQRTAAHEKWWAEFWNRSWIIVEANDDAEGSKGDAAAANVTRAYALQRWMNGCAGRGAYPIKFNGSMFTMDKCRGDANGPYDADYRAWGGGYWLQNTRLIYWSMLAAGDFDLMRPFFHMYLQNLPARKLAAKTYYGHEGAFYPETQTIWGSYLDMNYGIRRTGKAAGLTDNGFVRRYWQGGIEVVALMLDYYDLTQDAKFRDETLLPFAREIILFFDQHWPRGDDGKIVFEPAQSLETYWTSKNPLPEIAGLRYVLPRLQLLTNDAALKAAWRKTLADLPPVPTGTAENTGKTVLLPGETFGQKSNAENPELYAVFPYRLYTLTAGKNELEIGLDSWPRRRHKTNGGWQQDAIQAALLGHAAEARRNVMGSAAAVARGFRFPAIWGPNFDWMPDQDHGSVMVSALQRMLLQYEGDKILVLPAWPKDWNCHFKLHAPQNTTVEGEVKAGKLITLTVLPESRRKEVTVCETE